jgi:hypothetical protein
MFLGTYRQASRRILWPVWYGSYRAMIIEGMSTKHIPSYFMQASGRLRLILRGWNGVG